MKLRGMHGWRCLVWTSLLWIVAPSLWAAQLKNLVVTQEFDTLRLTFELTDTAQHRYSVLQNPHRVVVDILKSDVGSFRFSKNPPPPSPLLDARFAQRDADLRVVLDLDRAVVPKTYRLKAGDGKPERLVLELRSLSPSENKIAESPAASEPVAAKPAPSSSKTLPNKPAPVEPASIEKAPVEPAITPSSDKKLKPEVVVEPPKPAVIKPEQPSAKTAAKLDLEVPDDSEPLPTHTGIRGRKIVVALDAGHGGKDTGAIGAKGVREKDVVLAIAKTLADILAHDGRYKVVMTRGGDSFIPLKGRRDKARKLKADLFISIHADAFSSAAATGASVFALSQRGATSEMARFLADQENSSDLLGSVGGVSLEDKDEMLAGVLVDLSMTATLTNSLDVGARVLRELSKVTRLHNRTVEQAGFVVLKSPDVPSILVETGFISNPEEARQLTSPAFRQQIAQAIAAGVRNYFSTSGIVAEAVRTTPSVSEGARQVRPDTPKVQADSPKIQKDMPKVEMAKSATATLKPASTPPKPAVVNSKFTAYQVVAGDSLAKISERFNVSQKAILEANDMTTTVVKTGQRLKIPVK